MNILFIANLIPYPQDGGGKIFTFSVLQALSKQNCIDLICFYEHENVNDGIKELRKYCSDISVIYISHEMKQLIKTKVKNKKYDYVFFNILAMFSYFKFIKRISPKTKGILYEQNCETLIYKRNLEITSSLIKRLFLLVEIKKLNRFEQYAIYTTDKLFVLSDADRKGLGITEDNCSTIPIGINPSKYIKHYTSRKKDHLKMLFIGTMTWNPNNEGIIWFLKNVMPLCKDKTKYELFIVGKNPSNEVKKLCMLYENVNLLGYVESLEDMYKSCDVLVVPLFIGSGQRVKIIEAFSMGYAVISTSIGAEGLKYKDGENILIADTAEQFKKQIDNCFEGKIIQAIGNGAKKIFDEEYSLEIITKRINSLIQ